MTPTSTSQRTATINVALVGFGYAGQTFHAPLIDACAGLNLHTVVSRGDAATQAWPGARIVPALADALADPDIELVVIATPNDTHAPLTRQALEAGRAVVVDKPFALDLDEARSLVDLAMSRDQLLSVFHNRRWDDDFLALRRLIDDDALGRVVRFESHFDRYRPQVRDRWREKAGPGAGLWFDLGPHLIDQALALFGRPRAVRADLTIQRDGGQAIDYAHVVLLYDRLRVILHADALSAAQPFRFAVHGDRASFVIEGLDPQEDALKAGGRPDRPGWPGATPQTLRSGVVTEGAAGATRPVTIPPGAYIAYYDAIAAALRGQGPNPVTPEQALAVMEVLEAAERSNVLRREVDL